MSVTIFYIYIVLETHVIYSCPAWPSARRYTPMSSDVCSKSYIKTSGFEKK